MGGKSLTAYHLEGAHNAKQALNNEEYPFYCKLHGDFRYDSLKNFPADLVTQNAELSQCLINSGNRFGFVVAGYSGRDNSVIELFRKVFETSNPFPHGLYWTHLKGSKLPAAVLDLISAARAKGMNASTVAIETYDSMMMRLWRNVENKTKEMDDKVRRTSAAEVNIPLPGVGKSAPLLRLNALPVLAVPAKCLDLNFVSTKEWAELRQVQHDKDLDAIFTKADSVWCWGDEAELKAAFGADLHSIGERAVPADLSAPGNLHVHGFVEEALCKAMARERPLIARKTRNEAVLIVDFEGNGCRRARSAFSGRRQMPRLPGWRVRARYGGASPRGEGDLGGMRPHFARLQGRPSMVAARPGCLDLADPRAGIRREVSGPAARRPL